MSLITDHESNLATILENENFFGVGITLIDTNDVEYEFKGQVNIISRPWTLDTGANVSGERSNVTIRLSTFLTETSVNIDDIKTDLINWKVRTSPQPGLQPEKTYIIGEGGVFPDHHLGIITIFLTEVTIT
jgi:hypothetical protein